MDLAMWETWVLHNLVFFFCSSDVLLPYALRSTFNNTRTLCWTHGHPFPLWEWEKKPQVTASKSDEESADMTVTFLPNSVQAMRCQLHRLGDPNLYCSSVLLCTLNWAPYWAPSRKQQHFGSAVPPLRGRKVVSDHLYSYQKAHGHAARRMCLDPTSALSWPWLAFCREGNVVLRATNSLLNKPTHKKKIANYNWLWS